MQNTQKSKFHPPGSQFQTGFLRFWKVGHVISGDGAFGLPDSTMVRNLLTKNTTSFESDAVQTVCNRAVIASSRIIIEEYVEDTLLHELPDYKIYTFSGKPEAGNELGENRAGVHTCIPGEGAQCRIVAEEQDSENWEYRSAG